MSWGWGGQARVPSHAHLLQASTLLLPLPELQPRQTSHFSEKHSRGSGGGGARGPREARNVPKGGLPWAAVITDSLASAGDMASIPGAWRPHVPRGNSTHASQRHSLCSGALEPQRPKAPHPESVPHNERSHPVRSPATTREGRPSPQPEQSPPSNEDPAQPKTSKQVIFLKKAHKVAMDSLVQGS